MFQKILVLYTSQSSPDTEVIGFSIYDGSQKKDSHCLWMHLCLTKLFSTPWGMAGEWFSIPVAAETEPYGNGLSGVWIRIGENGRDREMEALLNSKQMAEFTAQGYLRFDELIEEDVCRYFYKELRG